MFGNLAVRMMVKWIVDTYVSFTRPIDVPKWLTSFSREVNS